MAPSEEEEQSSVLDVTLGTCSHTARPLARGSLDVIGSWAADWPEKLALRCDWSAPRSRSPSSLCCADAELITAPVLSFHVIRCLRSGDVIREGVTS